MMSDNSRKAWEIARDLFENAKPVDLQGSAFRKQIRAGWICQLIGGAMGTMVEGYASAKLYETFGEVRDFLRAANLT